MADNTTDLFLKNGLNVRDDGIFHSDVHIRGSLIVDGQTASVNTVKLTTKDKNIDLFVVDSDGFGALATTAWGNDNDASGGGFTLWSSEATGNKTWVWQKVYNTQQYTWVTNQSGIQSTQATFNLLSTSDTSTVNFANKTTTLNIAATATAALTADIGPALTNNVINFSTTAAGTHTIQSEIRAGTQNLFQQITGGTMNLGVTPGTTTTGTGTLNVWGSGTVNIGVHDNATTLVDIGGDISGNIVNVNGTGAGTTNIQSDIRTGTQNLFQQITAGTMNLGVTPGTTTTGTGTLNAWGSGVINLGRHSTDTTTVNVGGDISGNIVNINGTANGTTSVQSDIRTGTQNLYHQITGGLMNLGVTPGTTTTGTGTLNVWGSGTINLGRHNTATTTIGIGGDISGNIVHINGTAAGTASVTTDSNTINLINTTTKVMNFAGATETLNVQNGQFLFEKQATVQEMGPTPQTDKWVLTGTGFIDAGTF